jgi:hypothetical protein
MPRTPELKKEKNQARRLARIAAGLCSRCGKGTPPDGRRTCDSCKTYAKNFASKEWKTEAGKEKRRKRQREWQASNPEVLRARSKAAYHRARNLVFEHYGWKCACCGETEPGFLTIDHINNDGGQDRKANFYNRIVRKGYPEDLQTLCYNCNISKAHYGQCPHIMRKADGSNAIPFRVPPD